MRMRSRLPTLLLAHSTALLAAPDVCIRRSELARTDVHGYATAAGRLRLRSRRRETALCLRSPERVSADSRPRLRDGRGPTTPP